jgi:hypothetical protein
MSHLEDAKALVAQHITSSQKVYDLLDQLTANGASATQAAVDAATSDLAAANDALSQRLAASLAELNESFAKNGVAAPAAAPADASAPAANAVVL